MKTLKQVCAALVLTLTLALSAFAGEIQTTVVSQPPPPSTTQGDSSATSTGEIQTTVAGEIQTSITATNPATEIVLNLILGVFSLV